MQVLIAVIKNILNKVIIKNWTDLVRYLYCIDLDINEHNPVSKKYSQETRIVNLYDNKIVNRYI